jgi:hypothetical protein
VEDGGARMSWMCRHTRVRATTVTDSVKPLSLQSATHAIVHHAFVVYLQTVPLHRRRLVIVVMRPLVCVRVALLVLVLGAAAVSVSAAPGEFTRIRSIARYFNVVLDANRDGFMSQTEVSQNIY